MKKHLFFIASVFAAVSLQAQTPTVKVAANTNVKVKPGTLFYVNGDISLDNYTESDKKFSNEGNVRVTKKLKTSYGVTAVSSTATTSSVSFVNEYVGTGRYGQLIVSNNSDKNDGKIASVVKAGTGFSFLPLAIPYTGIKGEDIVKDLFDKTEGAFPGYKGPKFKFDPERLKNALFYWNNEDYLFQQVAATDDLGIDADAARYYAINTEYSGVGQFKLQTLKTLKGIPVKNEVTVPLKKTSLKDKKNIDANEYGEAYGSYIVDFAVPMPDGWTKYQKKENGFKHNSDFGSRVYNLGNPFTSNIDLGVEGSGFPWDKIEALVQYTSQDYTEEINEGNSSGSKGGSDYSVITGDLTGDDAESLRYVPPFGTFAIKMKKSMSDTESIIFNDKMKTFGKPKNGQMNMTMFSRLNSGARPVVNQVGLDLYDSNGFTGEKTYIVASNIYEAAHKGKGVEIYNPNIIDEDVAIYTLQENEEGTVNEALSDSKTYINGVNESKYIGKPIHLVFQNGKGQYTFKARLNESLENNKNSFYFEDKVTGKVIKMAKDFSYTFDIDGTDKDRFVLYWAATPNVIKEREVANESVDTTVVFKDLDIYKVKFDKSINSADIFVYNISGQLVNMDRNVDTSLDYIVPLKNNSSVYIIKIIGDNGKVITKKIIK